MFHLDTDADAGGTGLINGIDIAPAFLVERFGPPPPGDGHRVTGHYTFRSDEGAVFTVYDFKLTAAYWDDDEDALSAEAFWASRDKHGLSIGGYGLYGDGSADEFHDWLSALYK